MQQNQQEALQQQVTAQQQLQSQQQAQQQQQVVVQQQHQAMGREVLIGQPVHVQVLQGGNTAQVIKYEINIPQEAGQSIEWGQEAVLRIKNADGTEEMQKIVILK